MKMAKVKSWRLCVAFLGLGSSVLCALLGSLLTAASWFVNEPHNQQMLHALGGALLCLTIPLLLVGAFCLDGSSANEAKKSRAEDEGEDESVPTRQFR